MTKFIYNIKNTNIEYIFFKFNFKYYLMLKQFKKTHAFFYFKSFFYFLI